MKDSITVDVAFWLVAISAGVGCLTKLVMFWLAIRGVPPKERPAILRALVPLFRPERRSSLPSWPGRRAVPPSDEQP
ncbi:hypothetical protein JOD54_001448 [Actinokineospora baliensis]|uniref:hypothetical protein n=1 Tax=Actinokineospora baliensis TaxID=547056 RepID=UPI00195AFF88|nr:hypothetical protein [Actinokineospora baliensis]MBM7771244.1 hypothetical protein [Actinokineospora baliensis]